MHQKTALSFGQKHLNMHGDWLKAGQFILVLSLQAGTCVESGRWSDRTSCRIHLVWWKLWPMYIFKVSCLCLTWKEGNSQHLFNFLLAERWVWDSGGGLLYHLASQFPGNTRSFLAWELSLWALPGAAEFNHAFISALSVTQNLVLDSSFHHLSPHPEESQRTSVQARFQDLNSYLHLQQ